MTTAVAEPLKCVKMTKEEYLALPEGSPFYEYEDGEVYEVERPSGRHQKVVGCLWALLDSYVTKNQVGSVWFNIDVWLTEEKAYGPDIVYLSKEHLHYYSEEDGDIHGVPDLIVEALSPHSVSRDRVRKFNRYYEAGLKWYWIIDPDALTVEEYQHMPEGYLRTASVESGEVFRPRIFPDLEINLQSVCG